MTKTQILKDFREKFGYEGSWWAKDVPNPTLVIELNKDLEQFISTLVDQVQADARECPRHHEQLRCLGCLSELKEIEEPKPYQTLNHIHESDGIACLVAHADHKSCSHCRTCGAWY